jgi:hypothetical protein
LDGCPEHFLPIRITQRQPKEEQVVRDEVVYQRIFSNEYPALEAENSPRNDKLFDVGNLICN